VRHVLALGFPAKFGDNHGLIRGLMPGGYTRRGGRQRRRRQWTAEEKAWIGAESFEADAKMGCSGASRLSSRIAEGRVTPALVAGQEPAKGCTRGVMVKLLRCQTTEIGCGSMPAVGRRSPAHVRHSPAMGEITGSSERTSVAHSSRQSTRARAPVLGAVIGSRAISCRTIALRSRE
jgi:hypothetical protein